MKDKDKKTSDEDLDKLKEYLEKGGVTVTIDTNPSPEKIAEIRARIAKTEALFEKLREDYKNKE